MKIEEVESAALQLSQRDLEELVEHLQAQLRRRGKAIEDDPIYGLGSSPVDCDVTDGAVNHDRYVYGSPNG